MVKILTKEVGMYSLQLERIRASASSDACPFDGAVTDICSASLSSLVIAPRKRRDYCSNENYENCPVFLAKILRRR
jgi:hypothetical protein